MQPEVISDTEQEFNGDTYTVKHIGRGSDGYFTNGRDKLHRIVWEYHNGHLPVGKAHHVHHIDGNKANNNSGNLELMSASEHMRLHRLADRQPLSQLARDKAAEWHGSDKGVDWHKAHYEKHGHKLHAKTNDHNCKHCGKAFKSSRIKKALFCGRTCKAAARRASGVDKVAKCCENCGETFMGERFAEQRFCSRSCASRAYWKARKAE